MNLKEEKYNRFHLVHEMVETPAMIGNFNCAQVWDTFPPLRVQLPMMLTGEGSSRIFPAKNMRHQNFLSGGRLQIFTEGSLQLIDYPMKDYMIIGSSNSGKTKEIVHLFTHLTAKGHKQLYAVTCNPGSPLEGISAGILFLDNCKEKAVAATKSVLAQALVYDCLLSRFFGKNCSYHALSLRFAEALQSSVSGEIIHALGKCNTLYYAGHNNGVAEELTLKTNEILRKKSAYLPGTYLLHGIEEVIEKDDVVVLVDPIDSELKMIDEIYQKKIGATVIAFSDKKTPFLDIILPKHDIFQEPYLKLATGWNMMVEGGLAMGINMDKPRRARKIGNEAKP